MSDARRYAVWPEQGQGQGHSREVDRQSPTGLILSVRFAELKIKLDILSVYAYRY